MFHSMKFNFMLMLINWNNMALAGTVNLNVLLHAFVFYTDKVYCPNKIKHLIQYYVSESLWDASHTLFQLKPV